MSLKQQTISGVFWTFIQQFSVQLINFAVSIVLARILLPAEFGLIGMLALFMALGISLTDSGMTSSLIRKNDANQRDYSTVFFINLLVSIVVYAVVFVSGPLIADFFHQPILNPLVRLYAVSFIIRAFMGVQTTRLTKEMNFRLQMMMQIPSVIIGGIVGITMAYKGFGVWSLVWMNLVQTSLYTVQHWLFSGWRPSPIIDSNSLKFHFKYGYKLTLAGLLDVIYANAYHIIIGRFFSPTDLGYYTRAKSLQLLPVTNISNALNKVTFPMFAKVQDDPLRLKLAYQKVMHQVIFWIAPAMILLVLIAKPLIVVLLTDKWLPAVPFFQLLCFAGILYPFHTYNLNILKVKGRSDLFLRLEVVKKIFITIGITISFFWGIYALIIFQVISSAFAFWVNTWYSGKMIGYSGWQQVKDIFPTILMSLGLGLGLWLLSVYVFVDWHKLSYWASILITAGIYLPAYFMISYFTKSVALADFKTLILKR